MSETVEPVFSGEVMLAGWKEAHNSGCVVSFWLPDPADLDAFRGLTVKKGNVAGQRFACVLVEIADDETPARPTPCKAAEARGILKDDGEPTREPNELARKMHVDGYFRNPRLWERMEEMSLYTQEQHRQWIMAQPCRASGIPVFGKRQPCEGDICAHHTKAASVPAAGAGAAHPQKPPHWYTVPLCHFHHTVWAHKDASREDKESMLELAVEYTAKQMKAAMKDYLGLESLREITPAMLAEFERTIEL